MVYITISLLVLLFAAMGVQLAAAYSRGSADSVIVTRLLVENRRLVQLLAAYKLADREPALGHQFLGPGPFQPEGFDLDAPGIDPVEAAQATPPDSAPETAGMPDMEGVIIPMLGGDPERE